MKNIVLTMLAAVLVLGATVYCVRFIPIAAQNVPIRENDSPSTPTTPEEPANANHAEDWVEATLTDAAPAVVAVNLPADAKITEIGDDHWTFADAYLEKSRTMKTMHLDAASKYDATGCLESTDLERVIDTATVAYGGVEFCEQTGLSVGAGQVYRTMLYSSKDTAVPIAIFFTIHYANSVQVYAGCETTADLTKPECVAREFHDDDVKLFTNIMASLTVK